MANFVQLTDLTTNTTSTPVFTLNNNGDTLFVGENATLAAFGATSNTIQTQANVATLITINGDIYSAEGAGINSASLSQVIKIGATGSILAALDGMSLGTNAAGAVAKIQNAGVVQSLGASAIAVAAVAGARSEIVNSGQLLGDTAAVTSLSNGFPGTLITNTGLMHGGDRGIHVQGGSSEIVNHGTISSDGDGIRFDGAAGTHSIVNTGTIRGGLEGIFVLSTSTVTILNTGTISGGAGQLAIRSMFDGVQQIINSGTILGNVLLAGSNDAIDSRHGVVTGSVNGGTGFDDLIGGEGIDRLNGDGDNDTLTGNGGADMLNGGTGTDVMDGGAGNDRFTVDSASDQVIETVGGGIDTVVSTVSYSLADDQEIEYLRGQGVAALALTGNEFNNTIVGTIGTDVLTGEDGNDVLDGGASNDTLLGGGGNDTYIVASGDQVIEAVGLGFDTVKAGTTYVLTAGSEVELLRTLGSATTTLINLGGNEFNNILHGNAAANNLAGNGGADTLYGFAGNDSMTGGLGADILDGGLGTDTALFSTMGGAVVVTLNGSSNVSVSVGGVAQDTIRNIENVIGGSGNDTLTGDGFANALFGIQGNDILNGGAGDDQLDGSFGNDTLDGGSGIDTATYTEKTVFVSVVLNGGTSANVIVNGVVEDTVKNIENVTGGSGNDGLFGDAFANALNGGSGVDTLNGGLGNDMLTGGSGTDVFVFNTALNATTNRDTIADFIVVNDIIQLENAIFTALTAGPLPLDAFHIGAAAADAEDRIIYNSATGALFYDSNGVGGAAQIQFATLPTGLNTMTNADFSVI